MQKMDAELNGAIHATTESVVRERIHALKTLCELVLDEPQVTPAKKATRLQQSVMHQDKIPYQVQSTASTVNQPRQVQAFQPQPASQMPFQPVNQPKRLEMDDQANGDSLFDF